MVNDIVATKVISCRPTILYTYIFFSWMSFMLPNDRIFSHVKDLHAWNLFNTSTLEQSYFCSFYWLWHLIRE